MTTSSSKQGPTVDPTPPGCEKGSARHIPDSELPGTQIIVGAIRLGRVVRHVRGDLWVIETETDYYRPQIQRWQVRRAVVGETVCRKPTGDCACGLYHTAQHNIDRLPRIASRERDTIDV